MNISGIFCLRERLLLVAIISLMAFSGCAVNQAGPQGAASEPPGVDEPVTQTDIFEDDKEVAVKHIDVVGTGDAVLIEADGPVKYTAFRLTDPPRLIVDLPGTNVDEVLETITVDNLFITDIVTTSYGEGDKRIGRVEVGLKEGVGHTVKSGEDSVLVSLEKPVFGDEETYAEALAEDEDDIDLLGDEALEIAEAEDVEVDLELEDALFVDEEDEDIIGLDEEEADMPVDEATAITGIEFSTVGDAAVIMLTADGTIGNFNSFGLDDPARFVLDLWGLDTTIVERSMPVDLPYLDRVRIGTHPDKVRLVFDISTDTLPTHNVDKAGDTLVVSFGVSGEEAQEVAEEPEIAEEPWIAEEIEIAEEPGIAEEFEIAEEPGIAEIDEPEFVELEVEEEAPPSPVEVVSDLDVSAEEEAVEEVKQKVSRRAGKVKGVDFRRLKDKARLSIVNTKTADFDVTESLDGRTLTVDIFGSVIPEDLKMTLDARDLNTPVNTISSFQSSMEPTKDVRILVRLREDVVYEVSGDGKEINVDFPLYAPTREDEDDVEDEDGVVRDEYGLPLKVYEGEKITLEMVDAQVLDVLNILAEVSRLNIVALPDEVSGTITLRLIDVPWDQAFDLILKSKGLGQVHEGNIVRVAPLEKLRAEREAALAAKKAEAKLEKLETEYIRINYDEAASLAEQVINLLSDRGTATSHEPTNTLIIKDVRDSINEALDFIRRVDIASPQVLIEARIVEAESSFARDLGVQWGVDYLAQDADSHTVIFGSTSQTGQIPVDPNVQTGTLEETPVYGEVTKNDVSAFAGASNYAVNLPAAGGAGPLGALGFVLGKSSGDPRILDIRISAGEAQGLVKTISRPRITTMDNKEAKIEQGESIPFQTTSATGTETKFIDANLNLTVTPQITPDGSVLMEIKASRNSIGSFTGSGGEPSINKKEATTNVLVKDGETTVIGGIIISDTNESERGIPFLKDIPFLGWLFKTKSIKDEQRELLIFITPTILKDKDTG